MTEICIAPTPELIRYLCLFQRIFEGMRRVVKEQDEDVIVLMAWIADAIHNVPAMIWRCDPTDEARSKSIAAWVVAFPQVVRECIPPAHIMTACEASFSYQGAAAESPIGTSLYSSISMR